MKVLLFIFCVVFLLHPPIVISKEPTFLNSSNVNTHSQIDRIKVAENHLRQILKIYNSIPNLKPKDENWLRKEALEFIKIEKKDPVTALMRLSNLMGSPLYNQFQVKTTLAELIKYLECISQQPKPNLKKEMACWAKVASLMSQPLQAQSYEALKERGFAIPDSPFIHDRVPVMYVREILSSFLVPYLNGDLSE